MENNKQSNTLLLTKGTELNNCRYQVESHIASGGFGNTYKVFDKTLQTVCAVKEFFITGDNHRESDSKNVSVSNPMKELMFQKMKSKFKKEARRLMEIDNKHMVKVYDCFEENNTAYYVMELIDGERIDQRYKTFGQTYNEQEAIHVLMQMLDALRAIHEKGLIHMDIKPANILIDNQSQCKLIDFGASKQQNIDGQITTTSAVCYTQGYAPPEQVSGHKDKWGPWTDFYALGATLYNILSGNNPPTHDQLLTNGYAALSFPYGLSKKSAN